MRKLLSSTNLRKLEFLELLYEKNTWVTVGSASKILNCSEKSLRTDINDINIIYSPFHIKVSNKRGVKLYYPDDYSIDFIYSITLKCSPEFYLAELIFNHKALSFDDAVDLSYLSITTLKRYVAKFKKVFLPLEIIFQTSPFDFTGNENNIRSFFVHYYLERYQTTSEFVSKSKENLIIELATFVLETSNFPTNLPDLKFLQFILWVNIERYKHNHFTKIDHIEMKKITLVNHINENFSKKKEFEKIFEIKFNTVFIIDILSTFLNDDFQIKYTNSSLEFQQKFKTINGFLDNISRESNIPLNNEEKKKMSIEIFNILKLDLKKNVILFDEKSYFVKHLLLEFPNFGKILKKEIQKLEILDDFKWELHKFNEIFYTVVIHWPDLVEKLRETMPPIKIALFCDFDYEHSLFLKKLITFHFEHYIQITILNSIIDFKFIKDTSHYDLILTNLSDFDAGTIPSICINIIPNKQNWTNIKNIISSIYHSKYSLDESFIDINF